MARPRKHTARVNGAAVSARRAELGLTQDQVVQRAAAAGYAVNQSNVSRLEVGKLPYPSLETRLAITAALGLTDGQMYAPCAVCGKGWTAACLEHGTDGQPDAPARAGSRAVA